MPTAPLRVCPPGGPYGGDKPPADGGVKPRRSLHPSAHRYSRRAPASRGLAAAGGLPGCAGSAGGPKPHVLSPGAGDIVGRGPGSLGPCIVWRGGARTASCSPHRGGVCGVVRPHDDGTAHLAGPRPPAPVWSEGQDRARTGAVSASPCGVSSCIRWNGPEPLPGPVARQLQRRWASKRVEKVSIALFADRGGRAAAPFLSEHVRRAK
jgi:hypothetical protein